ncbi:hypothetical protein EV368DRAFT_32129 [Lentinula lateritia]|nr:hypothetical protein EV368DRAFT_32129 [Lentinula lateritia]
MISRDGSKTQITRRQLALTPGYAFTDYKGQGQTIEFVIVDLQAPVGGAGISAFSAYVSLSRSRGRPMIRLLRGFDEKHFVTHPTEALRKEDKRLDVIARDTWSAWKGGFRYRK